MEQILTHNGVLLYSDYLTLIFAAIASIGFQALQAQQSHVDSFKFGILAKENYIRWMVSFIVSLFLLYVLPDAYFYYMEDLTKENVPGTTRWNTTFSAIVGLSPLHILKKFIKISRSKLNDEIEKK